MKRLLAVILLLIVVSSSFISAGAEGSDDLVMSNCDSTLYWSANSQGADALEPDSSNFTEGSGSVGATAINGKLNQIAYIPDAPMDVSKYSYLEFDIYFSDLTWFSDCSSVMFEITSSGTSDKESHRYMKKVMRSLLENRAVDGKQNWWHFVLELDNPQGTANGALNKANFNFFRFYTVDSISTTPDYVMRIDDIRFTNNPKNYTPPEDDGEEASSTEENAAKPYSPEIDDPNAGVKEKVETLIVVEGIVLGVLFVGFAAFIIVYIIGRKKKAGRQNHE